MAGPRRKSRPRARELNAVGLVGLIIAILSTFVSFIPCMGWYAIIPALVGMVVGLSGAYASEWSMLSMYLLLIAVVTFRARGLFGKKSILEA